MWLFAGLGNPGDKYKNNRHNIGFMAVDAIAGEYGFPSFRSRFQSEITEGRIGGEKAAILKPQTYMNNSGQAIQKAAKYYKIETDRIYIFHDELDLDFGRVKIKTGGGNAGHNGLKSAQAHLGTPDFKRVRLGIGHPGNKARVHGYVLSDFSKAEREQLPAVLEAVAAHIPLLMEGHNSDFMSKVNVS